MRDALGDVAPVVSTGNILHDIGHFVKDVGHDIEKYGPAILSDVQGLISLVPGIGTGISAAIGTAEAILQGGGAIEIAIHAAYGAIPIPPGLRNVTDIVLDSVMEFVKHPHDLTGAMLAAARDRVPSGLPRQVYDTLIHVVAKKVHIGGSSHPAPKAAVAHAAAPGAAAHKTAGLAPTFSQGDYYAELYTNGLPSALEKGLASLPGPVNAKLSLLPDPRSAAYRSIAAIAPNLSVNPASAPAIVSNAQGKAGIALDPTQAQVASASVAAAASRQSEADANLRVAQQMHTAPRQLPSPANPGANIGIQTTPTASRVVASPALAHLIPQIQPA